MVDAAETFAEADVSVASDDGVAAGSGSVSLGLVLGSRRDAPFDDNNNRAPPVGVIVNPNTDLSGLRLTPWSDGYAEIIRQSDGTVVASGSVDAGEPTNLSATLTAGTAYRVVSDDDRAHYESGTDLTYPYTTGDFDVTDGYEDGGRSEFMWGAWSSVEAATGRATSGSATVGWPHPTDVYAWDRATFQADEPSGSVDVYLEADDGTGWSEVAGPIKRGDSIPADPSDEVRFRVDLSRPSASDPSPSLDAIYRRWVV
jgi:hypothetical protein